MKKNIKFIVLSLMLSVSVVCNAQTSTLKDAVTEYYKRCMTESAFRETVRVSLRAVNDKDTLKYVSITNDSCLNKKLKDLYMENKGLEDLVTLVLPYYETNISTDSLIKVVQTKDSLYHCAKIYETYCDTIRKRFTFFTNIIYELCTAKKSVLIKGIVCNVPESYAKLAAPLLKPSRFDSDKLFESAAEHSGVNSSNSFKKKGKPYFINYMDENSTKFYLKTLYKYLPDENDLKLYIEVDYPKEYYKLRRELVKNRESVFKELSKKFTEYASDPAILETAKKKVREEGHMVKDVFTAEQPSFVGGDPGLMKWLQKNLRYPLVAQENGIQGRMLVSFYVSEDGSITDITPVANKARDASVNDIWLEVTDDLHYVERVNKKDMGIDALEAEALRVVGAMPNWNPGTINGEAVKVKFSLPVTFRLQ